MGHLFVLWFVGAVLWGVLMGYQLEPDVDPDDPVEFAFFIGLYIWTAAAWPITAPAALWWNWTKGK